MIYSKEFEFSSIEYDYDNSLHYISEILKICKSKIYKVEVLEDSPNGNPQAWIYFDSKEDMEKFIMVYEGEEDPDYILGNKEEM